MRDTILFCLSFTILLLGSCSKNPSEPEAVTGTITGTVTNSETNEPVTGASITTQQVTSSKITDATGSFVIAEINPGAYND